MIQNIVKHTVEIETEKAKDWDHSCVGADCRVTGCPNATPEFQVKDSKKKKTKETHA